MRDNAAVIPTADRPYLAAFLDVRGQSGLVVGGGEMAAKRAETLVRSGMRVTVVAPLLCDALAQWMRTGAIAHRAKRFEPADIEGAGVVVAATDDRAVNAAVAEAAKASRIPVNVVDDPSLSTFIVPAVVERAPILVAISTGGASPVLARRLGALIEGALPEAYGRLAAFAARYRAASIRRWPEAAERARFWERILDGPAAELILAGRDGEADAVIERELAAPPAKGDPP
ncbi:MAG TPA: bifunctional precorrin-2 dehydrogenase/sirohydrochlorin ferrochelatase [Usitatibacter sp.]